MELGPSSEEDVVAAAVKQMVGEGEMAKELFVELMEYMMPRWDWWLDERVQGIEGEG